MQIFFVQSSLQHILSQMLITYFFSLAVYILFDPKKDLLRDNHIEQLQSGLEIYITLRG